jgi:hypothetical protein
VGIYFEIGSWTYINIILINKIDIVVLIIFLVIATITKRAQIPFSA